MYAGYPGGVTLKKLVLTLVAFTALGVAGDQGQIGSVRIAGDPPDVSGAQRWGLVVYTLLSVLPL